MLVEHFADLRHLSRVPLYDRPALLRAAVATDALAFTYGPESFDADGLRTFVADLRAPAGLELALDVLAAELVHVEAHYPPASPDRSAMVSDVARRLVEAVRS